MLKSLDILIGLSVVMLIVSMAVTLLNQAILTALARRGRCLQQGIADLLQHLDWKMPRQTAEEVAALVLTQPSIGKSKAGVLAAIFPSLQFGEVVHREELVKILLNFGSRSGEIKSCLAALGTAISANDRQSIDAAVSALTCAVQSVADGQSEKVKDFVKALGKIVDPNASGQQQHAFIQVAELLPDILAPLERVVASLDANGIDDPAKTLDNVRMIALQMEKSNPEQANDVRHSNALLQEAASPFLAKINFAFDQTMDRVSERFTYNARVVTFISAAVVAIVLQMDTVYIFNRLAMDDKMREAVVSQAAKVVADEDVRKMIEESEAKVKAEGSATSGTTPSQAKGSPEAAETSTSGGAAGAADREKRQKEEDQKLELKTRFYLDFIAQQGIINIAPDFKTWQTQWKKVNPAGIVLSILLLSLGAPFWYKAIGQLLQLRSILAKKDDRQRTIRQTTQTPDPSAKPGTPAASSPALIGERGDLNAV